uniref:Uncharacterized protein n=1 Tax=Rhizophora mucronata TaxID=61149 RepID=A0A2P2NRZ7_RHIMU
MFGENEQCHPLANASILH